MAEYQASVINPGDSVVSPEPPTLDKELPGYRYAKALCETARAAAQDKISSFKNKWDFFLGRNQWQTPRTKAAKEVDGWAFKGVVNWTYATVKTKAAMITNAQADTFVEAMDEDSTYRDRQLWKSAIDHELERLRFKWVGRDMFTRGAVCYVGIGMVTARPDILTGAMSLSLKAIDPAEFYCDPSADSITDPSCRFVVWEPELDMSTIRTMWPSKADRVKPNVRTITGGWTYRTENSADNLVYGSAGEYSVDSKNMLSSRKAQVSFVWIRDEALVEDLQTVLLKDAGPGYQCLQCSAMYEAGAEPNLDMGTCPQCGGDMEDISLPAKTQQNRVVRKRYPFGRLIVYAGETLLFDGENPYEIETVFPFYVYHHDRIPGSFYGTCDPDLLETLQQAENTVLSMGVDGVVLSMFGPFEYPVSAKSYTDMGNGPKERHPVPDHLAGRARFIPSAGADMGLWNGVLQNIEHQFTIVSGLGGPSLGQQSSPPISATEAEIGNRRLSDRMKLHSANYEQALSDGVEIIRQMMVQFYDQPMNVAVQMPNSEVQSTMIEVQSLPKVRIKVVISTEESIKDKLLGQNLAQGIQTGVLDSPYSELFLESIGAPDSRIKEVMEMKNLQAELVPPGAGMTPMPPGPPQPAMNGGGIP